MPKTVCIVDDQSSLRQMLNLALRLRGLEVFEAENGLEALDTLACHEVDLLIVDWQMPIMDGMELVSRLRDSADHAKLPIVMISCRDDLEIRKKARALGVLTWLKKPFRIAEVHRVVESILGPLAEQAPGDIEWQPAGLN